MKKWNLTEYLLQAAGFALAVLSVLFPLILFITAVPLIILTVRFHLQKNYLAAVVIPLILAATAVLSGGDFIYAAFTVFVLAGVLAVFAGLKQRTYKMGAVFCAFITFVGAALPFALTLPLNQINAGDLAYSYIKNCGEDERIVFSASSQINALAAVYFYFSDDTKIEEGAQIFDPDLAAEANEAFAKRAAKWGEEDFFYELTAFSFTAGILAYLLILILDPSRKKQRKALSAGGGEIATEYVPFYDMRLDFNFFKYVFLPVFAFSFLGYFEPMALSVATVFNAFVCVPCSFSAMSFFYHNLRRSQKAYQNILKGAFYILAALCLIFPLAAFIISFIGLADSLIRLRRLIDFTLRD